MMDFTPEDFTPSFKKGDLITDGIGESAYVILSDCLGRDWFGRETYKVRHLIGRYPLNKKIEQEEFLPANYKKLTNENLHENTCELISGVLKFAENARKIINGEHNNADVN